MVPDAGLEALAREVGAAIGEGDLAGKHIEVFLEHEDATVTCVSRTFARPITSPLEVRCALGLLFPESPVRPAEAIRVRLPELEKARRTQLEIGGGRSRSDQAEGVRVALGNVRKTFGDKAVLLAAEKAEPREVLVQRAYQEANGYRWTS